jgi:hypothetical protein
VGSQDNNNRGSAVPFVGHLWGQNQNELTSKAFNTNNGGGDAGLLVPKQGQPAQANTYIVNNDAANTHYIGANQQFQSSNGTLWTFGYDISLGAHFYDNYEYINAPTNGAFNNGQTGNLNYYPSDPNGGQMPVTFNAPSAYGQDNIPFANLVAVRVIRPHFGPLSEAYLDFNMSVPAAWNNMSVRFAIGNFSTFSPTYTANTSYTNAYIQQSWVAMNGNPNPLTVTGGVIQATSINLMNAIKLADQTQFLGDGYVLVYSASNTPSSWDVSNIANLPTINILNIHHSVLGIK